MKTNAKSEIVGIQSHEFFFFWFGPIHKVFWRVALVFVGCVQ